MFRYAWFLDAAATETSSDRTWLLIAVLVLLLLLREACIAFLSRSERRR